MTLRLVVGLGNPGSRYEQTRHNVGFQLADRLAAGADWKSFENDHGLRAKVDSFYVLKPMTYMNLSGDCVQPFAAFYKIAPEEMLVVYDELALPLGKVRIRPGGSAGGHNGMKSIIARLGTDKIPRLRIGIGPQPEFMKSEDFVLQKFKGGEAVDYDTAVEAVRLIHERGLEAGMNRYNPKA